MEIQGRIRATTIQSEGPRNGAGRPVLLQEADLLGAESHQPPINKLLLCFFAWGVQTAFPHVLGLVHVKLSMKENVKLQAWPYVHLPTSLRRGVIGSKRAGKDVTK